MKFTTTVSLIVILLFSCEIFSQSRFEIVGDGDQYIRIESLTGTEAGIDFIKSAVLRPSWRIVNDAGTGDFTFLVNKHDDFATPGIELLRLSTDEFVGISSVNPLSKLHIENGTSADLSNHGSLLIGDVNATNLVFDQDEILVRNNGVGGKLFIQPHGGNTIMHSGGGNVGIGISSLTTADSKLQINNGDKVGLTDHGFLMLGAINFDNLVMDDSNIQARDNSNASPLFLQNFGGNLGVNTSQNQDPVASLQVFTGQDVGTAEGFGYFMVGRENSEHLQVDTDDIQAMAGNDPQPLNLNRLGNNVGIGIPGGGPLSKLHIEGGSPALVNSNGYLMMGKIGGKNLVLDNEKIQARLNGTVGDLILQNDGGDAVMVPVGVNNRVGIGTYFPEEKLHIKSSQWQALLQHQNNTNRWYIGASDNDWGVGKDDLLVFTSTGVSNTGLLFLDSGNQSVGIGTHVIPNGYKVAVDGNILCEEVLVALEIDWPDYVFSDSYDLMPIAQLENHIKVNGHLPGIPSADQVAEDGINLGQMNARLLEKIEELTLYIIDIQNENDRLGEELEDLRNVVEKLKR